MKKQQHRPKFNDNVMVVRVKNYLAENVDKTFVDVSQMARSLKERYREYSNRNEGAFLQMVESAYKVVLRSYGLEGLDDGSSSEGSEEEDSDDLEMLDDSNNLNDRLMAMYKMQESNKLTNSKKEKNSEKTAELIDISSDEDSNAEKAAKLPKLGDQVTITPHISDSTPYQKTSSKSSAHNNILHEVNNKKARNSSGLSESKKRKTNEDTPLKSSLKRKSDHLKNYPKVSFNDVGGISIILEQVCDLILHMKHPEVYKHLGIKAPQGALLHGPPGTGKTLLANAISGHLKLPMITITATEMVGGVSGESEERIRELFEKAVVFAPCVLFIDEIDAICGNRVHAQKDMERRIVSQLLSSIDSISERGVSVLVLAATNNPDSLDPALRRAGRLEQEIALGIPSLSSRKHILQIICRNIALHEDVNLESIAQLSPGFVGADLQALVNKACTVAIKRVFQILRQSKATKTDDANVTSEPVKEDKHDLAISTSEQLPNGDNNLVESTEGEIEKQNPADKLNHSESNAEESSAISDAYEAEKNNSATNVQEEKVIKNNPTVGVTSEESKNLSIPESIETLNDTDEGLRTLSYLEEAEPYSPDQLAGMLICQKDFIIALKSVKPCAIREGIVTVPDVTWSDIGSLKDVREELQLAVLAPVKYPKQLQLLGLEVPSGILLCGPPGCGKTLLAKAVANEAQINFISVKGPELLNMYVGESERAVRTCFQRARNSAPCVIFFDEFDALCPKRSQGDNSGATRVVNQLLTEMDGIESRQGVFILAASNRPDIIDPAVLRPGRLDRVVYVGMPQLQDRIDILNTITKKGNKPPLSENLDIGLIATATEGFTGADLAGLVRQAATHALTQYITEDCTGALVVTPEHFHKALLKAKPSVSQKEQQHYEKLRLKYSAMPEEAVEVEMDTASANEESMDTV